MNENDCLRIMKALSDSSRLKVLVSIISKAQYVEELSERMGLSASTVSFHLKKLEEAGLVTKSRDQYYAVFKAEDGILDKTLRELISFENADADEQEERIRRYREKVLKAFFDNGRLVRLPAQYKKQQIVLEEIARRFEHGRKYPEKELNSVLLGVCEDYCTIRRMMIGEGLMERKDNVYWRSGAADQAAAAGPEVRPEPAVRGVASKPDAKRRFDKKDIGMKTRAELKREYKEMARRMGIIAVRNLRNGRMWIRSAFNPEATLRRFRFELEFGSSRIKELQKEWDEFGAEAFSFEVIDTVEPDPEKDDADELAAREAFWRDKLSAELENEYKDPARWVKP